MKVLHISTATGWRGGEQQATYLITELQQLNVACMLLCPQDSEIQKRASCPQVFTFRKKGSLNFSLAGQIKKICIANQISLIHTHDSHAHTAAFISAWLFGNKTPVIISRRVDFAVSGNFFSGMKYNHPCIKKIICVSAAIQKLTAPAIRDKSKLSVVHSGIDKNKFNLQQIKNKLRSEFNLSNDSILVGNVSALADHKDLFTFIAAAEKINAAMPEVRFFLIGEGPERAALQAEVKNKKLEQVLFFTGFRKDVAEILPELDIFLMTSKTEGLGTTLLDAFAAKVAVVATNAGGISEIVQDGFTGLISDVGDAENLSRQVIKLIENKELKNRLTDNAFKFVDGFTYSTTAKKTLQIYKEVLGENN